MMTPVLIAAALATTLEADLREVASLRGEPRIVSAAGVTRDETPILTLENPDAFDPSLTKRRLVLIGGLNGDAASARAVVNAVRWFKTRAPASMRQQWTISALPSAQFEPTDKQSLTRWVTFQAPDLVVTVGGTLNTGDALQGVPHKEIGVGDGFQAVPQLQTLLTAKIPRSPLHDELLARVRREPLAMARVLAQRYPGTPGISYIPALAWINTLRLAALTGDASLRDKVMQQVRPWLSGEQKLFGDRVQLTAVAGTIVFAEIAAAGHGDGYPQADQAAIPLAAEGSRLAAAEKSPGVAQYGGGWTDDMFMSAAVLARVGRSHGGPGGPGGDDKLDVAARLLSAYADRLQRSGGLFNHTVDGPVAWGRGNGFAAFGLMEALTAMPPAHASRPKLLEIYRRHMAAVKANQAPDGMWRQVIDESGSYREETATAMLMTAMARGVRFGWIDKSYLPSIHRAWRALAAHVLDDGTVVDVCASTGGGTTKRYYLDRPAIIGADDRGGAMALVAAMEMYELAKSGYSPRQ